MDNKQHTCDPCLQDTAIQNATSFCVVCVERLCDDCVKFHSKNKATRKHRILTGDDVPIDTDTFRLLVESAFCKTHPEREIQFKCEDHDEYICGICARNAHRHCEHMEEIDSEINENTAREVCQLTINSSKDLCDKLSIAKIGTTENIEKLIQEKGQAIDERRILFQSIITKLETKTYTDIDILYDDHTHSLRGTLEKITAVEQQQINDKALLDAALKYADTKTMKIITNRSARQLTITRKAISENENKPIEPTRTNKVSFLKTLIKHLEEEVKSKPIENQELNEDLLEKEEASLDVDICGSDEYASCMSDDSVRASSDYVHLGGIEETPLQDCQFQSDYDQNGSKEMPKVPSLLVMPKAPSLLVMPKAPSLLVMPKVPSLLVMPKMQILKQTMSLMERKVWLANVHPYDVSEYPSGLVLLQDGRFVTIGNKLERPTISVYNTNMIVIFELILDNDPYEICSLGENEIAITYSDYKRIDKFLILEDKIERHGGFSTKLYGRGITKHGNDIAVLFTDEEGDMEVTSKNDTVEIQIRRKDGKITDTIDTFEDQHGKDLFIKDPDGILSLPNEGILVGDKTHLRCFDMDGDCRWYLRSYKDHALKRVNGMTTDKEGNILVCGNGSNNVHQLCATNYRQNRVLIPQIYEPICIAYDAANERIIVGCGDSTIRVFKFI